MTWPAYATTIAGVQAVAYALPLLPDRIEAIRAALLSCWVGDRKEAYQDARRRAGIIRETVWIQRAAGADLVVVHLEADDLPAALTMLETSAEPFDRWFRDQLRAALGVSLGTASAGTELLLQLDADRT